MNKRQHKKQLKKSINNLLDVQGQALKFLINTLKEIPNFIETLEDSIKSIDDDSFEECLNKFENIALKEKVIAIRNGEKINWF